jgi:hypothetical protein
LKEENLLASSLALSAKNPGNLHTHSKSTVSSARRAIAPYIQPTCGRMTIPMTSTAIGTLTRKNLTLDVFVKHARLVIVCKIEDTIE